MLRTLGVLLFAGMALVLVAMGGKIGPYDLSEMPIAMIGFIAVSVLVIWGLRRI